APSGCESTSLACQLSGDQRRGGREICRTVTFDVGRKEIRRSGGTGGGHGTTNRADTERRAAPTRRPRRGDGAAGDHRIRNGEQEKNRGRGKRGEQPGAGGAVRDRPETPDRPFSARPSAA